MKIEFAVIGIPIGAEHASENDSVVPDKYLLWDPFELKSKSTSELKASK